MITRGFFRHHRGHAYFVHGVACLKHEGARRVVVYTSVKTEEGGEGFDFLARDEGEFGEWVDPTGGVARHTDNPVVLRAQGYVRRFERVTDPEESKFNG